MTSANMKLVVLGVTFPDKLEISEAKLDEGEHVVTRVVELAKLLDELHRTFSCLRKFIFDSHSKCMKRRI